jgi:hypothetical protein
MVEGRLRRKVYEQSTPDSPLDLLEAGWDAPFKETLFELA